MKQNRSQLVRDFVKENPGLTTRQIADGLSLRGIDTTFELVSAILSGDAYKIKPVIRKEPAGENEHGVPIFKYFYDDSGTVPRREPGGAAAKQRMRVQSVPKGYVPIQDRPIFIGEDIPAQEEVTETQQQGDVLPNPLLHIPSHEPTLDELVDLFAQAMSRRMMHRARHYIADELHRMMPTYDDVGNDEPDLAGLLSRISQPPKKKPRKPRVLIAGLLPMQAGLISQEFGEVFDLRFFQTEDNLRQLRKMLPDIDHVFTFTSKISHGVEEVMKSIGDSRTINRCSGGMTMLKDKLLELYAGGNSDNKP